MIQPALPAARVPHENILMGDAAATKQKLLEAASDSQQAELRTVFDDFVGQTFYSQMLSAMRKTVDKPAYFHGGRAEEIFQAQLDQTMSETLADATANQFTGPMFELFSMSRR